MDPVTEAALIGMVSIGSGIILGYVANDLRYKKGKKILAEMRKTIDTVDDAIYDDKITEEEFRGTWERLRGVYAAIMT
ncbi:MAG: hypothetical protein M0Q91_07580 [Methanoregula sp.]|jgi:hypothetical protein|nr:hypothetical protein [Methanoregula sp.]